MATIDLEHAPGLLDRGAEFAVVLDGVRVGQIRAGGAARFHVDEGLHDMRVEHPWGSSDTVSFRVADAHGARFRSRMKLRHWWGVLAVIQFPAHRPAVVEIERIDGSAIESVSSGGSRPGFWPQPGLSFAVGAAVAAAILAVRAFR